MRVALISPPSLGLPKPLVHALPAMAGALRAAGHEPRISDLGLLAADFILERRFAEGFIVRGRELGQDLARRGDPISAEILKKMFEAVEANLLAGEQNKRTLRDPERARDQAAFKRAFWGVVDALGTVYQLDPVISPRRPTFARDMVANQAAEAWTIHQELYEHVLVEAVLGREPALLAVWVVSPEQAVESVRFARRVRAVAPQVPIVFGGPLITSFADRWLEGGWLLDHVDAVIVGDDERSLVELVEAGEARGRYEDVTNLVWRDAAGRIQRNDETPVLASLQDAPLPDFGSFDFGLALGPAPIFPLRTTCGCSWGRCAFCPRGRREDFRALPTELLRRDVLDLVGTYGARFAQVQDAVLPPEAARSLAAIVREGRLDLSWIASMRLDSVLLDPEFCLELGEGGCRSLVLGMEATSPRIVEAMGRGFRPAEVPAMLANLRDAGISAELRWSVGFPGETRDEAFGTVRWLHENRADYGLAGFSGTYELHADTAVAERPADFGIRILGEDDDRLTFETGEGMPRNEAESLGALLAESSNLELIESAAHLFHLRETGLDLSGLARPSDWSEAIRHYGGESLADINRSAPARPSDAAPPYYEDDFGFRADLEARAHLIQEEWSRVPPELRVIWPDPGSVTYGKWDLVPLIVSGRRIEANLRHFPETARFLETVPRLHAASFTMLGPKTVLPVHTGGLSFILRTHLAVEVHQPTGICVDGVSRSWERGKTLTFDDLLPHYAWNFGDGEKVIFMVDFIRPGAPDVRPPADQAEIDADSLMLSRLFPRHADAVLGRPESGSAG